MGRLGAVWGGLGRSERRDVRAAYGQRTGRGYNTGGGSPPRKLVNKFTSELVNEFTSEYIVNELVNLFASE